MPDINWKEKFELLKKLNASPPAPASPEPVESVSVPPEPEIPAITAEADKIIFLSPDNLDKFPNDPFHEYEGETLEQFTASIREHGILTPIIVRPKENGKFEILSGRNRNNAAKLLNLESVPCIVRNVDDDEAVLIVAESNLSQRENQLPSEKAFAYKMQLEAIKKKAGRPSKINLPQNAANFRSDDILAAKHNMSGDTLQRYIRLTYLIPDLLQLVDKGVMQLVCGEYISYLKEAEQLVVLQYFFIEKKLPLSTETAKLLRELAEQEELTYELLERALQKKEKTALTGSVSLKMNKLRKYVPDTLSKKKDIEKYIIEALEFYREHGQN